MFVISFQPLRLIFRVKTFQLDDLWHVFVLSKFKITKFTFELFSQTSHKWLVQSAIEKLLLYSVSEIQLYEHTIPRIYYFNKGWSSMFIYQVVIGNTCKGVTHCLLFVVLSNSANPSDEVRNPNRRDSSE